MRGVFSSRKVKVPTTPAKSQGHFALWLSSWRRHSLPFRRRRSSLPREPPEHHMPRSNTHRKIGRGAGRFSRGGCFRGRGRPGTASATAATAAASCFLRRLPHRRPLPPQPRLQRARGARAANQPHRGGAAEFGARRQGGRQPKWRTTIRGCPIEANGLTCLRATRTRRRTLIDALLECGRCSFTAHARPR